MNIKYQIFGFLLFIALISMSSCQSAGVNKTGSEYMPDMAHSVAYEANSYAYYYNNRWGSEDELHKMTQPRQPVQGTIPRGYVGSKSAGTGISYTPNGSVPYYYANTEEDRTKAMAEIIKNPFPITKSSLEKGKLLYNIQCAICHGEKADGAGYLVRDDGGKYPVQPANLLSDAFVTASNGRYYHTLIYGRNLMGGYSDKLSYEERWNVIQYIRSLQAASKKLEYNEKINTFNTTDTPYSIIAVQKAATTAAIPAPTEVAVKQETKKSEH
ncbi:MAG: c-type cytochrome [Saprospiraceae bacterium]|nr:c-type cytochrome [Saprospiraceae bacterium]